MLTERLLSEACGTRKSLVEIQMKICREGKEGCGCQRPCQQSKNTVLLVLLIDVPAKMKAVAAIVALGDAYVVLAAANPDA